MRQRAERSVRRRMAVAADHRHARQGPALLGPHDMHNALTNIAHRIIVNAELPGVPVQRLDLNTAVLGHGFGIGAVQRCGHVVIRHRNGFFRRAHTSPGHAQPLEGLRAGHLMHEVAVNIQKAGAIFGLMGHMGIPYLVIERLGGHRSSPVLKFGIQA